MHTPDCILSFELVSNTGYDDDRKLVSCYDDTYNALQFLVATARSATAYMSQLVKYGIIDHKPDITKLFFQLNPDSKPIPYIAGKRRYYSWMTCPIVLPAQAVVLETAVAVIPDIKALQTADAYM